MGLLVYSQCSCSAAVQVLMTINELSCKSHSVAYWQSDATRLTLRSCQTTRHWRHWWMSQVGLQYGTVSGVGHVWAVYSCSSPASCKAGGQDP